MAKVHVHVQSLSRDTDAMYASSGALREEAELKRVSSVLGVSEGSWKGAFWPIVVPG